ncbi:MAG: hypothetical protein H6Q66_2148 [Firmicutes bacterium]|nr:hypothetical protein [Bacillota bacterium]
MLNIAAVIWNRIAIEEPMLTPWGKRTFSLDNMELAEEMDRKAKELEQRVENRRVVSGFLLVAPLVAEEKAIRKYAEEHPSIRMLLPEVTSLEEAAILATQEYRLTEDQQKDLLTLLKTDKDLQPEKKSGASDNSSFGERLALDYDDYVKKIVEEIRETPGLQSGDSGRFNDLWEEYAVQMQVEESYCFQLYEDMVKLYCEGLVEELQEELLRHLWDKSDASWEWDYEEGEPGINILREGVTKELIQRVNSTAADYELPSFQENDDTDSKIIYGRQNIDYDAYVEEVIERIRELSKESMQSGEDSPFEDVWEEYAAQVQDQESVFFEMYEDLVESACYKLVKTLSVSDLRVLWKKSDAYLLWDDEFVPEENDMQEGVGKELFRKVKEAAADYELPEIDEEDENKEDEFDLEEEDFGAIQVAQDVIQLLLSSRCLTARQVVGLGHALYALERLPTITLGVHCEFSISYRDGTEDFWEMRCVSFTISEEEFEISTGGAVYDKNVGNDSISGPCWRIEVGGYADRDLGAEVYSLEDSIREYLNLGAQIDVNDKSDILIEED